MTVLVYTRNNFGPTKVAGDVHRVTYDLNLAAGKGYNFAIVLDDHDNNVAFSIDNITMLKEENDESAIVG